MSKCFENGVGTVGTVGAEFEEEQLTGDQEVTRQYAENWDSNFKTVEAYANYKLKILRNDMFIAPTWGEVVHLRECETRGEVDAAFRSLIEKYWG